MREIVERLTENRQLERAKSILESNGYNVSKKVDEAEEGTSSELVDYIKEMGGTLHDFLGSAPEYRKETEDTFKLAASILGTSIDNIRAVAEWDEVDYSYDGETGFHAIRYFVEDSEIMKSSSSQYTKGQLLDSGIVYLVTDEGSEMVAVAK